MVMGVSAFDHAVRAWVVAHQRAGLQSAFAAVTEIGGVGPMRWVGVLLGIYLLARGRRRGAAAVVAAPFLALLVYAGTRRLVGRERPPSAAALHELSSSFPSAHSTTASAVCCTAAYVLWRERMLSAPAAVALAVVPTVLVGASRVYLDLHWATDVLGGWLAGLLIAAGLGALLYGRAATDQR
jgi:undecaprenyl-diphosphatase